MILCTDSLHIMRTRYDTRHDLHVILPRMKLAQRTMLPCYITTDMGTHGYLKDRIVMSWLIDTPFYWFVEVRKLLPLTKASGTASQSIIYTVIVCCRIIMIVLTFQTQMFTWEISNRLLVRVNSWELHTHITF